MSKLAPAFVFCTNRTFLRFPSRLFLFLLAVSCCIQCVFAAGVPEKVTQLREQIVSQEVPQGPFSCSVICADQNPSRAVLLDPNRDWNSPESVLWEWRPDASNDIAPQHRAWFSHLDEVKPVLGRSRLLVTASGGGVALIRFSDKKVIFYAYAGGNPHSAALLPDGNIVSVSSTGMFLTLFTVPKPEENVLPDAVKKTNYPYRDTHGIVWDDAQKILWVLGGEELTGFTYNFQKDAPKLQRSCSYPLQNRLSFGGHDLCFIPGTTLLFATGIGVEIFDTKTRTFYPFSEITRVKSISLSSDGVLMIQKPLVSWHSESVLFLNASLSVFRTCSGAQFYKARWWCE